MKEPPQGIYPPVVTPFRRDAFDRDAFRYNIGRWNLTELAGYVVLGSNGEAPHLDRDEALDVIEAAAEAKGEGKYLIAGTGTESTRGTLEFSRAAAKLGADAVLVRPPAYYRRSMTDTALEFHYRSVADSLEVPVLLYHVPKFAPVEFSPELVLRLAAHPNIAGIKESSGDLGLLGALLAARPQRFRVYAGTADILLAACTLGADGGVLALANVAPEACLELYAAVTAGDLAKARALHLRLTGLNRAVTRNFGVAGLKKALDLLGYKGGEVRRPLEPLSPAQTEQLELELERAGLLTPPKAKKQAKKVR